MWFLILKTAVSAPLTTAATLGGGYLGGWAVDKASEALTGKSIGDNVAKYTPFTSDMGEIINPGYYVGGLGTYYGNKLGNYVINEGRPYLDIARLKGETAAYKLRRSLAERRLSKLQRENSTIQNTPTVSEPEIVIDQDALNSVENILTNNNTRLTASRPIRSTSTTGSGTIAQAAQEQNNVLNSVRSSYLNSSPETKIIPRDVKKGELPYTEDEVNSWIDSDGKLKSGIEFPWGSKVYTGAHGEMYMPNVHPEQDEIWILRQHLANSEGRAEELKDIMRSNPSNRSGVLIETHDGDTSIDSTPLAYVLATRFAKRFKPLKGSIWGERVRSNSYGYNNAFKQGKDIDNLNIRAKTLLDANPDYKAKIIRDEKGNMIAYELTDENGTFQIPLNTRQDVLDIINARIHKFNKLYGTSYEDAKPLRNSEFHDYDPNNPYPWSFGETFDLPNIYGIAYKNGGKLKRKLLTQL